MPLAGLLYTPRHDFAQTKTLRDQYAGDPAMQQSLAQDDRYWTGRGMAQDAPALGMLALAGSLPYDMAKLAYFHGPKPVRRALESLTAAMFPGEGFNTRTTSRPSLAATLALMQGVADGTTGN